VILLAPRYSINVFLPRSLPIAGSQEREKGEARRLNGMVGFRSEGKPGPADPAFGVPVPKPPKRVAATPGDFGIAMPGHVFQKGRHGSSEPEHFQLRPLSDLDGVIAEAVEELSESRFGPRIRGDPGRRDERRELKTRAGLRSASP
jgi:hypothetical protein